MRKTIFQSHILPLAETRTALLLELCNAEPRNVICLYAAAFGVNHSDWLGKTLIRVKSNKARKTLEDILLCESVENRVAVLFDYTESLSASPTRRAGKYIKDEISEIRNFFTDVTYAGLKGLALLASLESLSLVYIPYIDQYGKEIFSDFDHEYIKVHSATDIKHSKELCEALEAEVEESGGANVDDVFLYVDSVIEKLLNKIFEHRNSYKEDFGQRTGD